MNFPELVELNEYRLTHDCTWVRLEEEMAALGILVPHRTLRQLVKSGRKRAPYDRTLYKIRQFLALAAQRDAGVAQAEPVAVLS